MRVRKKADVGAVYTSVFRDAENTPVEVFVTIGKTGGYIAGAAEVTGRLSSLALKYGASLEELASELVGISCGTPYGFGVNSVLSAFDAVGKSLMEISRAKQLQLPEIENADGVVEERIHITNGATNGHTNGYANGHTNGISNGQSNGHTNGVTEGLTVAQSIQNHELNDNPSLQMSLAQIATNQEGLMATVHADKSLETKFTSCPDCGSPLAYMEGCRSCVNPTCGWSKCS